MSAERDVSGELEDIVAEQLLQVLKDGQTVATEAGTVKVTAPASYFTAAVAFLKHRPPKGQPAMGGAKGKLKSFLEGENVLPFGGAKKQENA